MPEWGDLHRARPQIPTSKIPFLMFCHQTARWRLTAYAGCRRCNAAPPTVGYRPTLAKPDELWTHRLVCGIYAIGPKIVVEDAPLPPANSPRYSLSKQMNAQRRDQWRLPLFQTHCFAVQRSVFRQKWLLSGSRLPLTAVPEARLSGRSHAPSLYRASARRMQRPRPDVLPARQAQRRCRSRHKAQGPLRIP